MAIRTGNPTLSSENGMPESDTTRIQTVSMKAPAKNPQPIVHIETPGALSRTPCEIATTMATPNAHTSAQPAKRRNVDHRTTNNAPP